MAAFLNNELANKLVDAITDIYVVNMSVLKNLQHIDEETFASDNLVRYMNVLRYADPTLKNLNINFEEESVQNHKFAVDDFEGREMIIKSVRVDVESIHNLYEDGKAVDEIKLPFLQFESTGTIKLFNILPALIKALDKGRTIFIDEIENGLHPNLVKLILDLFYNTDTNPYNAQIICTTHNTTLVGDRARRDQIWIIEKNTIGESQMIRISDMSGVRNFENMTKRLNSTFGNVPSNLFQPIE